MATVDRLLATQERNYVIASNGDKVPVARLRGRPLLLYFAATTIDSPYRERCQDLSASLATAYAARANKNDFEVVFVSCDNDDECFRESFQTMPWLAIPYEDVGGRSKLVEELGVLPSTLPKLVIFDRQGRLWIDQPNATGTFLSGRLGALASSGDDHSVLPASTTLLIKREVQQEVKIGNIDQKLIGLYFAAHGSLLCHSFTPKLAAAYKDLKDELEIIFVSRDPDQESFAASIRTMPWPALPFADTTSRAALTSRFHCQQLPYLVIVDRSTGRTFTTQGCWIIDRFGSRGFPFTDAHIATLLRESMDLSSKIPGEHELCRATHGPHVWIINNPQPDDADRGRQCAICGRSGTRLIYVCRDCAYGFHPECAEDMEGNPVPRRGEERISPKHGERHRSSSSSSSSWLPGWVTRLVDPETKKTLIASAMAGLITAAVGVCSYCCSKTSLF